MILSVVLASLAVYSWKILGYLVPERFISDRLRGFSDRVTIALLAALVGIQGIAVGNELQLDARIPALVVAGLLLWLKVPYVLVVASAAAVAAGLRFLGF
ncbi:MAG TPA: AzlD domain-containing protein [Aquiluna sp.]